MSLSGPDTAPSEDELDAAAARAALAAALKTASARGANRRNLRVAIWHACLVLALDSAEDEDLISALEELAGAPRGHGVNADSPIAVLDAREMAQRVEDTSSSAQVIVSCFEPFLDDLDARGRDGLSVMMRVCFGLLSDSWGPTHLRRIIGDQIAALSQGMRHPILPDEPVQPNIGGRDDNTARTLATHAPHVSAPTLVSPEAPPLVVAPAPAPYRRPLRRIEVHIDVELSGDGRRGAFAFAAKLLFDGIDRQETRESHALALRIGNARKLWLTAVHEMLVSLAPVQGDAIKISATDPFVIEEALEKDRRRALVDEAALWAAIDGIVASSAVEWIYTRHRRGSDLAKRCDMLLHRRLAERDAAIA